MLCFSLSSSFLKDFGSMCALSSSCHFGHNASTTTHTVHKSCVFSFSSMTRLPERQSFLFECSWWPETHTLHLLWYNTLCSINLRNCYSLPFYDCSFYSSIMCHVSSLFYCAIVTTIPTPHVLHSFLLFFIVPRLHSSYML
jgi:hypothetical protein